MYLKWLFELESLFLVLYVSGYLYLYNVSYLCVLVLFQYSLLKQGEGFFVYVVKSKVFCNLLVKWVVGEGFFNEFVFLFDGWYLVCVSQDGCLCVFYFDFMFLCGFMKSYFGGLLCVCWSFDGCYVVMGGEDDLVIVWFFIEGCVVV